MSGHLEKLAEFFEYATKIGDASGLDWARRRVHAERPSRAFDVVQPALRENELMPAEPVKATDPPPGATSEVATLPKTPSFRLDGRRALVTGAGRGLGLAMAAALAEVGAEVHLAARTAGEVEAVAEAIRARGERASAIVLDVTDTDRVRDEIAVRGPFQVLVNNAGTNRPAHFLDVTEEDYDVVSELNVRAALFVAKAVAESLIEAGLPGSIINVSSQMGHVGGPKRTVYCATKHALEGATKAMAWELAEHRIRVNTICPTFIETPLSRTMLADAEFRGFVTERIATGTVGRPEDVMGAVVYLACDASSLVTGSALKIDGGWTAV